MQDCLSRIIYDAGVVDGGQASIAECSAELLHASPQHRGKPCAHNPDESAAKDIRINCHHNASRGRLFFACPL